MVVAGAETESEVAAYEFTTLTCIPGNVMYRGTRIQLLDLPGIIEGTALGPRCHPRSLAPPPLSPVSPTSCTQWTSTS